MVFKVLKRGFSCLFGAPKFACSAALAAENFLQKSISGGGILGVIYIVFSAF